MVAVVAVAVAVVVAVAVGVAAAVVVAVGGDVAAAADAVDPPRDAFTPRAGPGRSSTVPASAPTGHFTPPR